MRYDGRWRDRDPKDAPPGVAPVVRLKAPQSGQTVIQDAVQGEVTVENAQLDDMILLRADGTPTYMLAVVVDDHDMGVTHVIRGDDHLNNAFRQLQIISAMGWPEPVYAHIPLIHGPDGAKLSKRHGALGVDAYRDMGFLPAALRNYLLRLGWGHGDDEIISTEQAIEWFDLPGVGRSASRFDLAKLTNLNAHYLRETPDAELLPLVLPRIEAKIGGKIDPVGLERIERGLNGVKQRSRTAGRARRQSRLLCPQRRAADRRRQGARPAHARGQGAARQARRGARGARPPTGARSRSRTRSAASPRPQGVKLGQVAQPLRVALSGSTASPGIFEVLAVLGPAETKRDCWPPADRTPLPGPRRVAAMSLRVWIWLLSLSVLWGGSFFFAKVAIGELGPLTVVFARVALAALALTSSWSRRGRIRSDATRRGAPTSPWAC